MMVYADLRSAEVIRRLRGIDLPSVAEIGVYTGDMSRRLLYRINLHLLMVDAWGDFDSESYRASGDDKAFIPHEEWENIKDAAIKNVSWAADRVRVYQGTSLEAAQDFADEQFDLVFLDAAHDYDNVSADIEAWWPRVADGGWLGGHDYRTDLNYGVVEAVNDWTEETGIQVELGENFTWWARKHGHRQSSV